MDEAQNNNQQPQPEQPTVQEIIQRIIVNCQCGQPNTIEIFKPKTINMIASSLIVVEHPQQVQCVKCLKMITAAVTGCQVVLMAFQLPDIGLVQRKRIIEPGGIVT